MSALGYCGMNCAACPSYTTTVNPDIEVLRRAEAASASAGGLHWVCLGCTPSDQPILAKYSSTCGIRDCAIERKVQNCAACDDYTSCTQLHDFFQSDSAGAIQKRMNLLRQRYLALTSEE
ncbi:MAG: DUF3795 domain-containing protein [Candidatus Bipolaricaulis sp.]|nr:DUF3795 domain-containing protein [Candidatus Bipolaricaulis sp.]